MSLEAQQQTSRTSMLDEVLKVSYKVTTPDATTPRKVGDLEIDEKFQFAVVMCDYAAKDPQELNLEELDLVKVFSNANGKLYGEVNGAKGYFPAASVRILSDEEGQAEFSQKGSRNSELPAKSWYSKYVTKDLLRVEPKIDGSRIEIIKVKSNGPSNNTLVKKPRGPGQRQLWADYIGAEELAKLSLSKQEIKRQEVIFEIITTEADYIQDLEIILDLYIRPLEKNKLIRPKDMSIVFSNLEQVLPVNQELLRSLEMKQADNVVIQLLGEVLIRVVLQKLIFRVTISKCTQCIVVIIHMH